MVIGCIAHFEAANIKFANSVKCCLQFFAARLGSGAAQSLNQNLCSCKALEHRWGHLAQPPGFGHFLRLSHKRVRNRAFRRKDLRDDDPAALFTQKFDEPARCIV